MDVLGQMDMKLDEDERKVVGMQGKVTFGMMGQEEAMFEIAKMGFAVGNQGGKDQGHDQGHQELPDLEKYLPRLVTAFTAYLSEFLP